jgi:hypothetical protein
MKYFTPERIAQGQVEDHDLLDRHEEEWEYVCQQYEAHLKCIRPLLPPGLKHILESYYLHDATVLSIGQAGLVFLLGLQLDTPPGSILTFTYDLFSEPKIDQEALPADGCSGWVPPLWLYNEIERAENETEGWRESLLLSNGWEITLHFRDVKAEEFDAILPTSRYRRAQQDTSVAPTT